MHTKAQRQERWQLQDGSLLRQAVRTVGAKEGEGRRKDEAGELRQTRSGG